MPGPQPRRVPSPSPSPSEQPQPQPRPDSEPETPDATARRTAWWRTNTARFGLVAAVPALGLLTPRLGAVVLLAALIVVWAADTWSRTARFLTTVAAMSLLGAVVPDSPKENTAEAAPAPRTASATPTPFGARAAGRPTPTPTALPLADFRGQSLETAFDRARAAGYLVREHDASEKDGFVRGRSRWTVCFQETGREGARATAEFGVVPNGSPCPKTDGEPIPWPRMPDLVWKTWRTAHADVVALGVRPERIEARAAYANDTLPARGEYEDWRVCVHEPAVDAPVKPDDRVRLSLTAEENGCPEGDRGTGTAASLPDRDGDGDPDYRDPYPGDRDRTRAFPDGFPGGDGGSGGSSGGSGGGGWSPCRHTRWC
ncbi:hypothetical protein [Streptomyces sp. NPDC048606]|uniref:hypothetical protein n=1 Tax=Streptomyces sp. NPDC048606 TaxID=3154726 RepID=UPI00342F7FD5